MSCEIIRSQISAVEAEISGLQEDLASAPPQNKGLIASQIKRKTKQLGRLEVNLEDCEATSNFTYDPAFTSDQISTLRLRHRFAFDTIRSCGSLSGEEKDKIRQAYLAHIHHGLNFDPKSLASAPLGGSQININRGNFFDDPSLSDVERSQTLIHEVAHLAGYSHPIKRDPAQGQSCANPNPALFDCPGDNGVYYGTVPLRAEFCIAGQQSLNASGEAIPRVRLACTIDKYGISAIVALDSDFCAHP